MDPCPRQVEGQPCVWCGGGSQSQRTGFFACRNTSVRKHVFSPNSVVLICLLYLHSFSISDAFWISILFVACRSWPTFVSGYAASMETCVSHMRWCVNGGGQTYDAFLYVSLLNCDLAGLMLDVLELSWGSFLRVCTCCRSCLWCRNINLHHCCLRGK